MIAVAAHEISHLKIGNSNDLEADRVGIYYIIKAGMHEKDFLSILYWMQRYCQDNPDYTCSTHSTYLARIGQIESSMGTIEPE